MNRINCIKFPIIGSDIWLVSIKDKMFGEIKKLQDIRKKAQQLELDINFLIYDVVEANQDFLSNILKADLESITDATEIQLIKENFIRNLIGNGNFGHQVFKQFLDRVENLLNSTDRTDRVIKTVMVGLEFRSVNIEPTIIDDRHGYITSDQVKNNNSAIGIADYDVDTLINSFGFGEKTLNDIYEFLTCEYSNLEYLPISDEENKEPELLTNYYESESDLKKPQLL